MAYGFADFTTTRTTRPDRPTLTAALVSALGVPAVLVPLPDGTWRGKKDGGDWTPAQLATAQTLLDTSAPVDQAIDEIDVKVLKAVAGALWECIPSPLLTKAAMRARAIAIWKALP